MEKGKNTGKFQNRGEDLCGVLSFNNTNIKEGGRTLRERMEGREEGKLEDGRREGRTDGRKEGQTDGRKEVNKEGRTIRTDGRKEGRKEGRKRTDVDVDVEEGRILREKRWQVRKAIKEGRKGGC